MYFINNLYPWLDLKWITLNKYTIFQVNPVVTKCYSTRYNKLALQLSTSKIVISSQRIPDHLTTEHKSTIWIPGLSGIQMVTVDRFDVKQVRRSWNLKPGSTIQSCRRFDLASKILYECQTSWLKKASEFQMRPLFKW